MLFRCFLLIFLTAFFLQTHGRNTENPDSLTQASIDTSVANRTGIVQYVEGYRKDVAIVDIDMLNTVWYPSYLVKTNTVSFDTPANTLEKIDYMKWSDSTLIIKNFSWTVAPSNGTYLLRGDRVLLSLLCQNMFKRDLFFVFGFPESSMCGLSPYVTSFVNVLKFTPEGAVIIPYSKYKSIISNILKVSDQMNLNSTEDFVILDYFRYTLLDKVEKLLNANEKENAKELILILETLYGEEKFPYHNSELKNMLTILKVNVISVAC